MKLLPRLASNMDRVERVNEFSSFITESQKQIEGILSKLKWTKEELFPETSSILVNCPVNDTHRVPKSSLEKHIAKCKFTSQGIELKDVCPSSQFFYKSLLTVVPVLIDKEKYNSFKGNQERSPKTEAQSSAEGLTGSVRPSQRNNSEIDLSDVDFGDESVGHRHEELSGSLVAPANNSDAANQHPLEEIRAIYRWKLVPANYRNLELSALPPQVLQAWLTVNVPQTGLLSSMAGADVQLVKFVMSCLNEQSVAHPDGLVTQLNDLLRQSTKPFVLKLWKFLAASIICHQNGITEIDRAHAELLAAKDVKELSHADHLQPPNDVAPPPSHMRTESSTEASLPMDMVRFDLTPQQRLAMYEYTVQVGKDARTVPSFDLDEHEVQTNSATESGKPKSKFEILAEERDYKRRRQSYRAKNVHITKRSAVEVMRDLIETQMAVLEGQYREEHEELESSRSEFKDSGAREVPDERGDSERHRNNNRDWDRGKVWNREKDWRDRRGDRDGHRDGERDRDRDRDRGRDRDRERDRDRDRERDRDRDKDRVRHKERDRDSNSDRHRHRDRHRGDRNRDSDRDRERDTHSRDRDSYRSKQRTREHIDQNSDH